jgi:peptidoglycan hydrolase CwlO-like protein
MPDKDEELTNVITKYEMTLARLHTNNARLSEKVLSLEAKVLELQKEIDRLRSGSA